MVNFPTSLSNEEKHLKEMFEKLKAVVSSSDFLHYSV